MPNESLSTFAKGASEFVVHEPLEKTSWLSGSSLWSFTPRTNVGTSPLAGAEMMTFLAPPLRWAAAATPSVKWPVDSMTTSAPTSPQGMVAGSDCAKTLMRAS
jgi:hypothetical protein